MTAMHQQKVATEEPSQEDLLKQIVYGKAEVLLCIDDTPAVNIYEIFLSEFCRRIKNSEKA